MHSHTVVGYIYRADIYCDHCVGVMFKKEHGPSIFDGTDAILRARAAERNIDHYDESTYDSDDFPKVIFADHASDDDTCGNCHDTLLS